MAFPRTKLTDLDAAFTRLTENGWTREVASLAVAQGVEFLCPKCFAKNGGGIGTHHVILWFSDRGVPDEQHPGPGRWAPVGTSVDDLSLVAGSSSVKLPDEGCGAHFYVRNGYAEDSP